MRIPLKCNQILASLNRDISSLLSIVTALLSALFRSTDLVPSDVVAGCVLLRVRQKRETREMRRIQMLNDEEPIYTTDVNKVFSETPPWMNLDDALHYLRLSIAAYGWPYVLYRHCFTGFCKLARHLTCCCCRYVIIIYVLLDNII